MVIEAERTKPITQPNEAPVPERIEQMSFMEPIDELMCQEGKHIRATMMIQRQER